MKLKRFHKLVLFSIHSNKLKLSKSLGKRNLLLCVFFKEIMYKVMLETKIETCQHVARECEVKNKKSLHKITKTTITTTSIEGAERKQ